MVKKILIIVTLLIIILCFIPFSPAVVVYKVHTNDMLAYATLSSNQQFQIEYIHSIHLSPVVETYERTANNEIKQIELTYEDFAIGMPSQAEGQEKFVEKDGKYFIKNMNRIFPTITLRVGRVVANHTFIIGDKSIAMSSFTEPGSVIRIEVKKLSLWQSWKGVKMFD
ncbi:DUF1850 domain-containing protein [Bacillus massiliigorillae]|uniref:DUF1850 domain-containing protein n=1 Tax=Bacillus massiliigorillae TaxID=1243664 RepID=UPI0003A4EA24|nr:DUF1850 domain-containing protein [Bacillus massiliigorillae]